MNAPEPAKNSNDWKVRPLARDSVELYRSPNPQTLFAYSPGLARCPKGRLVATIDLGGPDVEKLEGPKLVRGEGGRAWQGQVYTSDDRGQTWQFRSAFPFMHARPFIAGKSIYVLGQGNDLMIIRSDDDGQSWSPPVKLTEGQSWHQAPCNVHYANGNVYLVMERRLTQDIKSWPVGELAPVLMRGPLTKDLTEKSNWTFASEKSFRDTLPGAEANPAIDYFGVPFFDCPYPQGTTPQPGRNCAPMGWLESNVVQFTDPDHYWHDPKGKTFHLWMRAHTGGTGYACVAKVVEQDDGSMETLLEKVPSGKTILYIPCPGGQMKFHILFDEKTHLYWLLSTQAVDSMTRTERLPANRYNLPNNERRRLQLHFSKNCVDWCFAGLVDAGNTDQASRHYASMLIDDDDLHVLSRSGDPEAKTAHDGNLITFHTIRDFRSLVY